MHDCLNEYRTIVVLDEIDSVETKWICHQNTFNTCNFYELQFPSSIKRCQHSEQKSWTLISEVISTVGCTILGLGQGSLWCALGISRISDLAPDNSPGVTLGTIRVKIIREYLVAHRPLLCHPEPNNWLSLSLIVTICSSGQLFILSATSQLLTG